MRRSLSSIVSISAVLASAAARAQPAPPPERLGLELAVGLDAGNIFCKGQGCDGFTEAGGLDLNVAYFLRREIGLYLEGWVMAHTESDVTIAHYVNTVGVKWRPFPVITVQVGVGESHATLAYGSSFQNQARTDNAFALMGAAAFDVVRSRTWAVAVEVRAGNGFYGDRDGDGQADTVGRNVGVGATFTYFGF